MISIKPVVREDLDPLSGLKVRADQEDHVAPKAMSIAEFAYVKCGYIFSIRTGDEIAGLMGIIDCQEHGELKHDDIPTAAFLMRMMVADTHQGKGTGKAAMLLAFQWARARGNTCFQPSVVPGNDAAMRFYETIGMRKTVLRKKSR